MTPDGIADDDWDLTMDFAAKIANATFGKDEALFTELTQEMLKHLDHLEKEYGPLPSILAMKAEYTEDLSERIRLFSRAWQCTDKEVNRVNRTLIASSLAEIYIDEVGDLKQGKEWLGRLEEALGDHWDDGEYREYQRFVEAVRRLEGSPDPANGG